MGPPRRRIFVDVSGATCPTKGSVEILEALRAEVARRGLQDQVTVEARGCFGLCRLAPNLYIEPDGIWYSRLTLADVEEIVEEHLVHGRIVRRLVHYDPPRTKLELTEGGDICHDPTCRGS